MNIKDIRDAREAFEVYNLLGESEVLKKPDPKIIRECLAKAAKLLEGDE